MNRLPKVVHKRSKRVGRGAGSGKGFHTSGRGQKGQKARGGVGILFEGVKVKKSLLHRLPMLRGKARFKSHPKAIIINLDMLNLMPDGSNVTIESLAKAGIVKLEHAKNLGVKVLGSGDLKKKLTVNVPLSNSAKEKIEKLGGKVESK